jgi:hypothetical protein
VETTRTLLPVSLSIVALLLSACSSVSEPSDQGSMGSRQTIAEAEVSDAIVDVTAGSVGTWNWSGQSVSVPAGSYVGIRFHWYHRNRTPSAFGKLYLLTQEFLDVPGNLPNAAGLVASSASIEADEYVFPPAVTLTGPRMYWFYTDAQGDFANSFDIDTYPSGVSYVTGVPTLPFRRLHASGRMVPPGVYVPAPPGVYVDANFRLSGVKR